MVLTLERSINLVAAHPKIIILGQITENPNTLSAIKINVLLFTCVLVSFLSRLEGI